jgi:hypothetical protein
MALSALQAVISHFKAYTIWIGNNDLDVINSNNFSHGKALRLKGLMSL